MKKILSTKFSHWSYEKELRIFIPLDRKDIFGLNSKKIDDLYYLEFSDKLELKEVIVGVRFFINPDEIKAGQKLTKVVQ